MVAVMEVVAVIEVVAVTGRAAAVGVEGRSDGVGRAVWGRLPRPPLGWRYVHGER